MKIPSPVKNKVIPLVNNTGCCGVIMFDCEIPDKNFYESHDYRPYLTNVKKEEDPWHRNHMKDYRKYEEEVGCEEKIPKSGKLIIWRMAKSSFNLEEKIDIASMRMEFAFETDTHIYFKGFYQRGVN